MNDAVDGTARRLSAVTRHALPPRVAGPGYDRDALTPGIVHLGLGAFVRAHLALYTEDVLTPNGGPWGIVGVSLRRPDQRDLLQPQDGLYTTLCRNGAATDARVVGCLTRLAVAPEAPAEVVALMADPACRIVSLTVTEKGYCHDPASGQLDGGHPDIVHDLRHPAAPRSAIGLLVASLATRRAAGVPPFTVLCCDNLPQNGRVLAALTHDLAAMRDRALAGWIAEHVCFPCTMVDRIVPAVTDTDLRDAQAATGLMDAAPVCHEPFRQWVIEDRFGPLGRPSWERAGAEFVADVAPFEHMKLRMLNGAHSALAYLGFLAGHGTIADTVADPSFRSYVLALWEEVIPVVPVPAGLDIRAYADALLARFANTAVRHQTWQIAMDGSQKLPHRLLSSMRHRLKLGFPMPCLALAVAGWIRYVGGKDEAGRPIDVRDPMAAVLRATLDGAGLRPADHVAALLDVEAVFGADLRHEPTFVTIVTEAYVTLVSRGSRASVASVIPA